MEGWLGALVSLSLVLAAAPAVAVTSPVAQVEDTTMRDDEDPGTTWQASVLVAGLEPRIFFEASLEDGAGEASLELAVAETETEVDVRATPEEGEPPGEPIAFEAESGDDTSACVNIYLPQTPPVYIDPDCVPDIDDSFRP